MITPEALAAIADTMPARDVLALTLHHEAGGEPLDGIIAVGCVIRNRQDWGKWGSTIQKVCLGRKQFSCWRPNGGAANHARLQVNMTSLLEGRQPPMMRRAFEVADAVLAGCPDLTDGSDHYYAPAAMQPAGRVPDWAVGRMPRARIAGHLFFRLRDDAVQAR